MTVRCYRPYSGYEELNITPAKPPEPEMTKPDFIALRLECLKLAVAAHPTVKWNRNKPTPSLDHLADIFLRYAIDGSVDKAKE